MYAQCAAKSGQEEEVRSSRQHAIRSEKIIKEKETLIIEQ
jgi:hypothetical protein